jgi:hypothetical protein
MLLYIYAYFAYLLGMVIHVAIKIMNINNDTPEQATPDIVLKQFLKSDWKLLFLSFLGGAVWLIAISFYLQITPDDTYIPNVAIKGQATFKKGIYLGSILAGTVMDLLILGVFSFTKKAIDKKFNNEDTAKTISQ